MSEGPIATTEIVLNQHDIDEVGAFMYQKLMGDSADAFRTLAATHHTYVMLVPDECSYPVTSTADGVIVGYVPVIDRSLDGPVLDRRKDETLRIRYTANGFEITNSDGDEVLYRLGENTSIIPPQDGETLRRHFAMLQAVAIVASDVQKSIDQKHTSRFSVGWILNKTHEYPSDPIHELHPRIMELLGIPTAPVDTSAS